MSGTAREFWRRFLDTGRRLVVIREQHFPQDFLREVDFGIRLSTRLDNHLEEGEFLEEWLTQFSNDGCVELFFDNEKLIGYAEAIVRLPDNVFNLLGSNGLTREFLLAEYQGQSWELAKQAEKTGVTKEATPSDRVRNNPEPGAEQPILPGGATHEMEVNEEVDKYDPGEGLPKLVITYMPER